MANASLSQPTTKRGIFAGGRGSGRQLKWWHQLLLQLFCIIVAISVLFPVMWIVTLSLSGTEAQRPSSLQVIPTKFDLGAYKEVIKQPLSKSSGDISFWKLMANSFFLAAGVSFFSVLIGVSAAYAFARMKFAGRGVLFLGIGFILLMPAIATLAPLFAMLIRLRFSYGVLQMIYFVLAGLILAGIGLTAYTRLRDEEFKLGTLGVVLGGLALAGLLIYGGTSVDTGNTKPFEIGRSLYGVGLAMISGALPFAIWNLKGYLDTIPKELEEAAIIDGATPNQIFFRIVLPLAAPALAVTAFLGFMTGWTEFALTARFINQANNYTMAIALQTMTGQYASVSWANFAAMSIMISLPVSVVYLMLQKYIVGGLTLGGVKG